MASLQTTVCCFLKAALHGLRYGGSRNRAILFRCFSPGAIPGFLCTGTAVRVWPLRQEKMYGTVCNKIVIRDNFLKSMFKPP